MKKRTDSVLWIAGFLVLSAAGLCAAACLTFRVDPFFHYHRPDTTAYFYSLNNERSQNDGILRHFEYRGLITGTSMSQNFKTSEAEALWDGPFVKVPFSGGSYKEINDNILKALRLNPGLKTVIRALDMNMFADDSSRMRSDLGAFPDYLYDDNPFNDVRYLLNRDVFFSRVCTMMRNNDKKGFRGGITSFDRYSNWMKRYQFGRSVLYPDGVPAGKAGAPVSMTGETAEMVLKNVRQNITAAAEAHPDVTFYCFFTPYSAGWWKELFEEGTIYSQVQKERLVTEELLKHRNIRLFSFNNLTEITTDLNNYKDLIHYGEWVNSLILRYMAEDRCLLTEENYEAYLAEELDFYTSYDYRQLNAQEDYENDYEAADRIESLIKND